MSNWTNLIQTFGLAVTMLAFLAWSLTQAARWAAPKIEKMIDRLLNAADRSYTFDERLTKTEQRIETLWDFQLRRATVEVMQHEVGKVNHSIVIGNEAKSWLDSLTEEIRFFYLRLGRTLSYAQLAEEIERRYGEQMVKEVCVPHGLFQGVCLLIAMQIAKEELKDGSKERVVLKE